MAECEHTTFSGASPIPKGTGRRISLLLLATTLHVIREEPWRHDETLVSVAADLLECLDIAERFWSKVDKNGPTVDHVPGISNCWVWAVPSTNRGGYGLFRVSKRSMLATAHRVAWSIHNGPIPKGLCVLHRCDNRRCVRPEHLWLGTQRDNIQDMVRKGRIASGDTSGPRKHPERMRRTNPSRHGTRTHPERIARGERAGTARFTAHDVAEIRRQVAEGELQRVVAARFGTCQTTISAIVRRRTWAHI